MRKREDIYSLIGAALLHLLLLLLLAFTFLKTVVPEEDGGILVNFGNIQAASGTFEPKYTGEQPQQLEETTPPPTSPEPEPQPQAEESVTQDVEESINLEAARRKEEARKKEEEARKQKEIEERRRREEEEKKRKREEAISNKVAGAFGISSAQTNSQGGQSTPNTASNEGSLQGNSDQGANDGVGSYGSFNLEGRSIGEGGLPRPSYTVQEEGEIVVNITVTPKGDVIFAEVGQGTNITDASLRRSALSAARKAKFSEIQKTNNQRGTITYRYRLR